MDFVNAAIVIAFNLAVLGLLIWFVGSIALRFVGWGWMLFGLAIAVNGAANGSATLGTHALALFNVALGAAFWIGGHGLWAAKHGTWKSAIACRIVRSALVAARECETPGDTRDWRGCSDSTRRAAG